MTGPTIGPMTGRMEAGRADVDLAAMIGRAGEPPA